MALPPTTLARIAGLIYLFCIGCGLFATSVRASVFVPGDAATTADNIRASATLYRLSFFADLITAVPYLVLVMLLYLLLRHVSQLAAAAMVVFLAVQAVNTLNLLNQYTALTIATGDAYHRGLGQAGADALTLLFTDVHHHGYRLGAAYFGAWLVPLGYLVIKSGYFPRVLGVLLIIGCFGYLAVQALTFLAPTAPEGLITVFIAVGGFPEILFMGWLLVRGVRLPYPGWPALAPATPSR